MTKCVLCLKREAICEYGELDLCFECYCKVSSPSHGWVRKWKEGLI